MENIKATPLCFMPLHALTITGRGDLKPCCQLKGAITNIKNIDSLHEYFSSQKITTLVDQLCTQQKPESCISCWDRESKINASRRTWFNDKLGKHFPTKEAIRENSSPYVLQMDINLSNRCNLKCRMCGVWGSHKWIEEEQALHQIDSRFRRETRSEYLNLMELSESHINMLMPTLKNIKRIDFKGGEPLLAPLHTYLLKRLIEENLHTQVHLHYTSNGTFISPEIVSLFKHFKRIYITISLEAIGTLYKYIRGHHNSLDLIEKNIKKYVEQENVFVNFNVTLQAYNTLALNEVFNYLNTINHPRISIKDAFKYTIVNTPTYLSPWVLPRQLKDLAAERIAHIPELETFRHRLLQSPDLQDEWLLFCRFTKALDHMRNEDIISVVPEFKLFFS